MALDIDSATSLMEGLSIANTADEINTPDHPNLYLRDSIRLLDQSAQITSAQAQEARVLAGSRIHRDSLEITEISSLCRIASEVANAARILDDTVAKLRAAAELSIIAFLTSLGDQPRSRHRDRSLLRRLLSHFDARIRRIVRGVLGDSGDDSCVPWKIAEECYMQAITDAGALNFKTYVRERAETCCELPLEPGLEAEGEEHEDCLVLDDGDARSDREPTEQSQEERERDGYTWVGFWVTVLRRCPHGPTLFYPPASHELELDIPTTPGRPRHLFRTFDKKSSGRSDENTMASIASLAKSPEAKRADLLSLPQTEAIDMLHTHLTKECCGGDDSDNLVSWTSSLLFAIQYALWRRRQFGCHPADIKICAVDTRRFPPGQFARDMWLLDAYRTAAAREGGEANRFFRFRLADARYHNGEYLSQGWLDHAGRSCVVSLKQLEESGLYRLYPEFAEAGAAERWANRVLELRARWARAHPTSLRELHVAMGLVRTCFESFEAHDMVLILLAFKARVIKAIKGYLSGGETYPPEWAERPDELRRYFRAVRIYNSRRQSRRRRDEASSPTLNLQIFRDMFV